MTLTRVSTLSLQQSTLTNALQVQNRIFDAQQQISSGLKAQTFAELPTGDVELLSAVQDKLAKTRQYQNENARLLTRVDSTDQALSQLIDLANEMKNLIVQRRNGAIGGSLAFEQQLRSGFQSVANQLNTNVDGRYVFSGARTDTKPIEETSFPSNFESGVPDSGYYLGSTDDVTSRIQDDRAITSNLRADESAFQDLMTGFATALEGHGAENDQTLQQAYTFMQKAVDGIINLRANLGATRQAVVGANDRHEAQDVYWKGVQEDKLNADVVALATKLSSDSATLQATFQTFARINNLKLSDYL